MKDYFITAIIEKKIQFYIHAHDKKDATKQANNYINNSKHGVVELINLDVEEFGENK